MDRDAGELIDAGLALHRAGALEEAERHYRGALALEPANLDALQLLGMLTCSSGREEEAVTLLEQALAAVDGHETAAHAVLHVHLGNALLAAGDPAGAVRSYDAAITADPGQVAAVMAEARALVGAGKPASAAGFLSALAALRPGEPEILRELGRARFAGLDREGAVAAFQSLLGLSPEDVDALYAVARIRHEMGELAAAEAGYRAVLRAAPDLVNALFSLAVLLRQDLERPEAAIEVLERLLHVAPDHAEAHQVLGAALESLRRTDRAILSYRRAIALDPSAAKPHYHLGRLLREEGRLDDAASVLARALELEPDDAPSHVELGNVLRRQSRAGEARAHYRRALALKPLVRRRARVSAPFSVLAVSAPGANNTPSDYLFGRAAYDINFLLLLAETPYDVDLLRANGDIVVNLISDADQGRDMLLVAAELLGRLGRPVINHPDRILPTDRATVAALLRDLPGCHVPAIRRHDAATLLDPGFLEGPDAPRFPFLLRLAGTHGGDTLERIDRAEEIAAFLRGHPDRAFYAIDYADYRSADGLYRKYRFFFVGDEILPYHLAIGHHWKVHHFRTDMANQPWMKREETAFLEDPQAVFSPAHVAALATVRRRIGLDFFGIDCGIDGTGRLVLFETNASMLVQPHNPDFPYKLPHVRRIKEAWDALLTRRAAGA